MKSKAMKSKVLGIALAIFALLALPALAAVTAQTSPGWTYINGDPGLCVDVLSDGAAGVRVSVTGGAADFAKYSYVEVNWDARGASPGLATPARIGLIARARYHGRSGNMDRHTVWIPTKATEPLAFTIQLISDGQPVWTRDMGVPAAADTRGCNVSR